jgi:hypothetical protein
VEKVVSGGGAKASPRSLKEALRGLKTQEGIGSRVGLNRQLGSTDRQSEQRPGGDARGAGGGTSVTPGETRQRQEGTVGRKSGVLAVGETP